MELISARRTPVLNCSPVYREILVSHHFDLQYSLESRHANQLLQVMSIAIAHNRLVWKIIALSLLERCKPLKHTPRRSQLSNINVSDRVAPWILLAGFQQSASSRSCSRAIPCVLL